jgi:hypothetical protein
MRHSIAGSKGTSTASSLWPESTSALNFFFFIFTLLSLLAQAPFLTGDN